MLKSVSENFYRISVSRSYTNIRGSNVGTQIIQTQIHRQRHPTNIEKLSHNIIFVKKETMQKSIRRRRSSIGRHPCSILPPSPTSAAAAAASPSVLATVEETCRDSGCRSCPSCPTDRRPYRSAADTNRLHGCRQQRIVKH